LSTGAATSLESLNKPFMAKLLGVGNTIVGVALVNRGSGYPPGSNPQVTFTSTDGTGSGAAAICTVDGDGHITSVTMTDNGSGYTSAPLVTFGNPIGNAVGLGMLPWQWAEQDEFTSVGLVDKVGGRYGTTTVNPAVNPNATPTLFPVYVQLRRGWFDPVYDWVYTYTSLSGGGGGTTVNIGEQIIYVPYGGDGSLPYYPYGDPYGGGVYAVPNPHFPNQGQAILRSGLLWIRFKGEIDVNNGGGSYQLSVAQSLSGGGWTVPQPPLLATAWEQNSNTYAPIGYVADVEWDSHAGEYRFHCDISNIGFVNPNKIYDPAENDGNCHQWKMRGGVLVQHDGNSNG
jgi:hypothetical protein